MACAECGLGLFNEERSMGACFRCMQTMTLRLQGWLWGLRNRPPRVSRFAVETREQRRRREADALVAQLGPGWVVEEGLRG